MLDRNQDTKVTFDEVALFAKERGLDYAATLTEFSGLDANRDGQLDSSELTEVLSQPGIASPPPQTAPIPAVPLLAARKMPGAVVLGARLNSVVPATTLPVAKELPSPAAVEKRVQAAQKNVEMRVAALSEYAEQTALEASKEAEAQELDRQASLLRANATAMLRRSQQAASQQGSTAARVKAEELFKSLVELQNEAMRAEVRAAATRAKSEAELKEVNDLMFVAQHGLHDVAAPPS